MRKPKREANEPSSPISSAGGWPTSDTKSGDTNRPGARFVPYPPGRRAGARGQARDRLPPCRSARCGPRAMNSSSARGSRSRTAACNSGANTSCGARCFAGECLPQDVSPARRPSAGLPTYGGNHAPQGPGDETQLMSANATGRRVAEHRARGAVFQMRQKSSRTGSQPSASSCGLIEARHRRARSAMPGAKLPMSMTYGGRESREPQAHGAGEEQEAQRRERKESGLCASVAASFPSGGGQRRLRYMPGGEACGREGTLCRKAQSLRAMRSGAVRKLSTGLLRAPSCAARDA